MQRNYTASWCRPCQTVAPIYEQLSERLGEEHTDCDIACLRVDIDTAGEHCARVNITAVPTFHIVKAGKIVEAIQGPNMHQLQRAIEKLLK